MAFEQLVEGDERALPGVRVDKQSRIELRPDIDGADLEGELFGVGVGVQLTSLYGQAHAAGEGLAQLAHALRHQLPHRTGAIVEFIGGRGHDAAARQLRAAGPLEPVLDDGAQARQARRLPHRGLEHEFRIELAHALDDGELQSFLGAEVGEQPALGQAAALCQRAYGQAGQTGAAGDGQRLVQNGCSGLLSFAHTHIIARTFEYM